MMKRFMSALIVLLCSIVGVCAQQQGKTVLRFDSARRNISRLRMSPPPIAFPAPDFTAAVYHFCITAAVFSVFNCKLTVNRSILTSGYVSRI